MDSLPDTQTQQTIKELTEKFIAATKVTASSFKDGELFTIAEPEAFKKINSGFLAETLKVMTYNAANFQDHPRWDERCKAIAAEIDKHSPDLIGIQELRYTTSLILRVNMINNLLSKLRTPYYVLFKSAMNHGNFFTASLEGLTILSKHPIVWHTWQNLPDAKKDLNKRIKLTARILPKNAKGEEIPIDFTVTHFTYDLTSQERQAEKMRELLDSEPTKNQTIVGDFNTETQSPMWHLTKKQGSRPDFTDCHLKPTWPAWNPEYNLDKIFYRGDLKHIEDKMIIQSKCESKETMDSDHLYVIAEFCFDG